MSCVFVCVGGAHTISVSAEMSFPQQVPHSPDLRPSLEGNTFYRKQYIYQMCG